METCLRWRWATLGLFAVLAVGTVSLATTRLGFEFMPELEEGNLYIRATLPANVSLDGAAARPKARSHGGRPLSEERGTKRIGRRPSPRGPLIQSQVGRPDDGTDPSGFNNVEFFVPLHAEDEWPAVRHERLARLAVGAKRRRRTKAELTEEMHGRARPQSPGIDWGFSQYIRDNVMEAMSGVKGDNSVKIIGPDIDKLEEIAEQGKKA